MKRHICMLVCAMFILTGISSQALAASMDQTAGIYGVGIQAKLKVKKEGGDKSSSSGAVAIVASNATTGFFALDDYAVPDSLYGYSTFVTGTLTMFKGKKCVVEIDSDGLDAIGATIFRWLSNYAASEGVTIYSATIYFEQVKTSKLKVNKSSGSPKGKVKLKIKGIIEADTSEGSIVRRYQYQTKVAF